MAGVNITRVDNFFNVFLCLGTCMPRHECKGQRTVLGSVLSFHFVGPRDLTEVIRQAWKQAPSPTEPFWPPPKKNGFKEMPIGVLRDSEAPYPALAHRMGQPPLTWSRD